MPPVRCDIQKLDTETAEEFDGIKALRNDARRRNTPIKEDVSAMETTLRAFQASLSRKDSDLYGFLATVYAAYVTARANGQLEELLDQCGPKGNKGINKRTHPIAVLLKGLLGEKGQASNNRQTILEWKNCLCGLLLEGVRIADARRKISKHGVSALAHFFMESKNSENIEKRKKMTIRFDKSIIDKANNIMSSKGKAKAIIEIVGDGSFTVIKLQKI